MADYSGSRPYSLLFTSLRGATGTGAGDNRSVPGTVTYAISVQTTGSPASFNVNVEGTLDGTNWSSLGSITAAGVSWQVDKPVSQIRANLTTLTGGTAPTVTAMIMAV